jgi:hypothetical protein
MPAIYLTPAAVAAADETHVPPIDLQHLAACEIAAVFGPDFRFHRLDALISVLLFVYEPTAGRWFTVAPYSTDPKRGTAWILDPAIPADELSHRAACASTLN